MNKGFTLIETLVVSGIIIILTALILPNFRFGEKQFSLQRSAQKLVQDLRRAEEFSMSAASFSCPEGQKLKGYGIYFRINPPNNTFYSLTAKCVNGVDAYIEKEKIILEKGVKIKELRKDNAPSPSLNVFFYPPDPYVDLDGANEVKIILSLEKDAAIKINKAGLIYNE